MSYSTRDAMCGRLLRRAPDRVPEPATSTGCDGWVGDRAAVRALNDGEPPRSPRGSGGKTSLAPVGVPGRASFIYNGALRGASIVMSAEISYSRIRGIVFDLDGTLIDSYAAIAESLNVALDRAGMPAKSVEEVRGMVGLGLETLIERALGGKDGVEEGVRRFRAHYDRICVEKTTLLPEVSATLRELDQREYLMSVATNKPSYFAWRILEGLQ